MKKLVFILTLLLSLNNLFSQENPIYGSKVVIRKRDTSSAELQIINSTRNVSGFLKNTGGGNTIFKIPSQSEITALPDSLLARYTKTQADARFKSISYIPDWLELTGVPSNFSTTYALSNDIQDSLLNKVSRSGSYADPSWITSINYSKLVGTVPTWNQNTTGNAATVTNGVYTTGSYANPAWITSLDYSKLTGTVPTWNQNTTGNAATVTNGVYTTGSYADPSWISSLGWSKISGAPAFITGINSSMVTTALGYTPENISNKGIANGYADLDAGGKIPASRIDFGQTGQTVVVASQAAMLAVSGANIGALAVRTDESKNYRLIAQPASTLGNWQLLLSPDAPVQSVNGYTGNVNLLTTHISEGSNYWWTAARSRAAQSLTTTGNSGSATYDNSTGVLNVPTYTLAGLGGISLTSLSFTPGSGGYNSSTGVITIPTNTNQLTNGAGFITGYTETDPTIYAWAKAATKPSYIYSEIGGTVPTWNQSTTGNAATATSTNWLFPITSYAYSSSSNPTSLNYGIQTYFVGPSEAEGSWQNYGSIVNLRTYSGGGASMQMYIPYSPSFGGTGLQVRFGNYDVSEGNSWTSWKTLLATDNYNSYAPSLTGVGASGNWGINITGNSATVTNGVYTTGSYADPSWITSLNYSKLTGTVPTWNQNTTGSAATLSAVLASSLGGAGTVSGILKANGSGVVSAAVAGTDYALPSIVNGTSGTIPKFTSSSTIGNSLIAESGSTITVTGVLRSNGVGFNSTPTSSGTAQTYAHYSNTGNAFYVGNEGSAAGGFFTGSSAYAAVLYSNTPIETIVSGTKQLGVSSSTITAYVPISGTSLSISGNINQGGGTASNTAGFNNNLYLESTIPSITLSNTGANTGKFTLGVTGGQFGLWNNGTSAYEIKIDPIGSGLIELNRGTRASGELYTTLTTESTSTSTGALRSSGGLGVASAARIGGNVFSHSGFRLNPVGSGGWDRSFGFLGMSSTARGGFGAFGSDDNLEYYYVGTYYASNIVRFNLATSSTTFYGGITGTSAQLSSILNVNGSSTVEELNVNGDIALTGTANRYIQIGSNSNYYWRLKSVGDNFQINMGADALTAVQFAYPTGAASFASTATSTGFIRSGSSDSYFLLGGGGHVATSAYATVSSLSSYATTASLSGYVDVSSNQYEIGGNKTFLADVVVNGKLTGSRILGNTATYTSAATISSSITTAFCSNSSGSNYTLTMPSASGVTGQIMTVILTSGTLANTVTLSGINGGSYVLTCYASVVLVSDGSTWKIASVYNNTAPCS